MKVSHLIQTEDRITDTALGEWGMVLIKPPAVLLVVSGMILAHSLPVAVSQVPMTINRDMKALVVRPVARPSS
jgi:type I restriction enzyme S subunit